MARTEGRIAVSIWSDADFLALPPLAQRHFMFLLSQPDLAHDGVIALRERRWARSAPGMTVADITEANEALAEARFVVIDEEAEELLVRSFIRRDGVYRQPNVLRAAAGHLATVASDAIRRAVAAELVRIESDAQDIPEGSKGVLRDLLDALPEPFGEPFPEPFGEGLQTTSGKSDGERGVVTAVGSASPSLFPLSTSPVPPPQPPAAAPRARARERGIRIPDDFAVTTEMVEWARRETPGVDGRYETSKFVDYWRGKTGRDATKTDWPATWRNWMRKAAERAGPRVQRSTTDQRVADALAIGARLQAEADRKAIEQ